jgi:hypothetical protein
LAVVYSGRRVFESSHSLSEEIQGLLGAIRVLAGGRYACLLDHERVLFESADEASGGQWVLRQYLDRRRALLFCLPDAMAAGTELDDLFAEWESPAGEPEDEFLLVFVNRKVVLVVSCRDAEAVQGGLMKPLRALADRLFRLNPAWRLDEKGRGLFLSRPKLDFVVIGRPAPEP